MRLMAKHFKTKLWRSLNKYEMLVLHMIVGHSNIDDISFPSYDLLRDETKLMRKTISKALKGLEVKGAIKIERSKGNNNIYDLETWNNL